MDVPFYRVEYETEITSDQKRVRNEWKHDSAGKSVQVLEAGLPAEMQVGATQLLPQEVMSVVPASH